MLQSGAPSRIYGASKNLQKRNLPETFIQNNIKYVSFVTNTISYLFNEYFHEYYSAFVINEGYFYFCVTCMTWTSLRRDFMTFSRTFLLSTCLKLILKIKDLDQLIYGHFTWVRLRSKDDVRSSLCFYSRPTQARLRELTRPWPRRYQKSHSQDCRRREISGEGGLWWKENLSRKIGICWGNEVSHQNSAIRAEVSRLEAFPARFSELNILLRCHSRKLANRKASVWWAL